MLNFYIPTIKITRQDKIINHFTCEKVLLEENEINSKKVEITWGNLSELNLPKFNVFNYKKGRVLKLYNGYKIKEWEEPLNLIIETEYKPCFSISLNDVLNYNNIDLALQYLSERGLLFLRGDKT